MSRRCFCGHCRWCREWLAQDTAAQSRALGCTTTWTAIANLPVELQQIIFFFAPCVRTVCRETKRFFDTHIGHNAFCASPRIETYERGGDTYLKKCIKGHRVKIVETQIPSGYWDGSIVFLEEKPRSHFRCSCNLNLGAAAKRIIGTLVPTRSSPLCVFPPIISNCDVWCASQSGSQFPIVAVSPDKIACFTKSHAYTYTPPQDFYNHTLGELFVQQTGPESVRIQALSLSGFGCDVEFKNGKFTSQPLSTLYTYKNMDRSAPTDPTFVGMQSGAHCAGKDMSLWLYRRCIVVAAYK